MKKFTINLLIFIGIYLAVALPLQRVVDAGLKKSDFSKEYKEWDDITKSRINADILIQGSSKARLQISPAEFEQAFNKPTYNLGMDGQHFRVQKWRFDVYLKYNKKPKYIVQVIALHELLNGDIDYNYTQFIPYLNEGFIQRFGGHGFLNYLDFYVPLYKYCHQTGMMEAGLSNFFRKHDNRHYKYKGFRPSPKHWREDDFTDLKSQYPHGMTLDVDPVAYADFIDMIKTCKKEKIDLILVCPPTPVVLQNLVVNRGGIMRTYQNLATKFGLKYLDYSRDTICRDTAMFYNYDHLNTRGVAVFNKQLVNDLKAEIK